MNQFLELFLLKQKIFKIADGYFIRNSRSWFLLTNWLVYFEL